MVARFINEEAKIERSVCNKALNQLGIANIKLKAAGYTDRAFLCPFRPLFIEFKAVGEEPRPLQVDRIDSLRKLGYEVQVHDDEDKALAAIHAHAVNEIIING